MRSLSLRLALGLACLGLPGTSGADSIDSSPVIELRDEGASQGGVKKLDCTGTGVTCSRSGVVGTINVTGGGGSGYATIQDEGSGVTQRPTVNFTGAGVSCVDNAGSTRTDCTISGGGGGSANTVSVTVDFGNTGATVAKTVVTGQAWVTTSSVIACTPTMMASADRTDGMEDAIIEGLTVSAYARVNGTGFTVAANPRRGRAYKKYTIHCTGA